MQANEPDNTITAVPVESLKAGDAGEVVEDNLPIKSGVNGDAEVNTSGGSDGADLDLADQTLVNEVSRDADTSIIQEIVVGGVSFTFYVWISFSVAPLDLFWDLHSPNAFHRICLSPLLFLPLFVLLPRSILLSRVIGRGIVCSSFPIFRLLFSF